MLSDFILWIENNMLSCFYVKYFGFECYGCGFQRSFVALLRGNFIESFKLFPALFPILFIFIYLILHLRFKFKKGALIIQYSFICIVAILLINYIFKLLN